MSLVALLFLTAPERRRAWRCGLGSSWPVPKASRARSLGIDPDTVGKWRRRFAEHRLDGLWDEPRSETPRTIEDARIEAVIVRTLETKRRSPPTRRTGVRAAWHGPVGCLSRRYSGYGAPSACASVVLSAATPVGRKTHAQKLPEKARTRDAACAEIDLARLTQVKVAPIEDAVGIGLLQIRRRFESNFEPALQFDRNA